MFYVENAWKYINRSPYFSMASTDRHWCASQRLKLGCDVKNSSTSPRGRSVIQERLIQIAGMWLVEMELSTYHMSNIWIRQFANTDKVYLDLRFLIVISPKTVYFHPMQQENKNVSVKKGDARDETAVNVIVYTQQVQKNCIAFIQCWANVEDVGPTLYNCYTNVSVYRVPTRHT